MYFLHSMSALGQEQTFRTAIAMSALQPIADIPGRNKMCVSWVVAPCHPREFGLPFSSNWPRKERGLQNYLSRSTPEIGIVNRWSGVQISHPAPANRALSRKSTRAHVAAYLSSSPLRSNGCQQSPAAPRDMNATSQN